MIYKINWIKSRNLLSFGLNYFILGTSHCKLIFIKFLKDPSTRGNSPNFGNKKTQNET